MDEALSTALNQLLTLVATAAIGAITLWVQQTLKQWRDEKRRAFVVPMFTSALNWASKQFAAGHVPTKEEVLKEAVDYMYAHANDALKALGIDEAAVKSALEARLPKPTPTP